MNELDLKNILATTASVCTILQFLTGTFVCQKIVQNKSTGDISPFPFVSGLLSTSLWLRYGFLIDERSIILVNTIGATLFFAYVATFFIFSIKKCAVARQFLGCFLVLITTILYIHKLESEAEAKSSLGLICCFFSILFFAAPFASLLHVIKVKNVDSLPYPLISSNFIVSLQWLLYGIVLHDQYIQVTNFLGCLMSAIQLSLFVIYPKGKTKAYSHDLI